ncbi:MAG TPA: tRNA (adenosine(37)-N6)-dimethylallyltransferase MiaA [Planctomycetota bacterium]|nr:tRNA (adenosine(37)-N6)-dimethylallyltransferase MiaA [Planctomycetota bacterium]HQB00409.1 tRNA (adenosine(37)-N6)-dimethylallyltransferase MiaA [Planctomycetota bacterium]
MQIPIPICIIMGPTGSGKTTLAHQIAKNTNAEIISADSMAIYRQMNIGTAKPTKEEQEEVPYHLINIREPWETYNTGNFVQDTAQYIQEIRQRHRPVILVGGTVLYIKRLLEGICDSPSANWTLREQLSQQPMEELYLQLQKIDPLAAKNISSQDQRRIIRALEVYYDTGIPITQWQRERTTAPAQYQAIYIGIQHERQELYRRIETRIDRMMEQGLIEETKHLLSLPYPLSHTAEQAIGYKETIAALQDNSLFATLADDIKCHTRQFAKRQLTWLRRFSIHWLKPNAHNYQEAIKIWLDNIFLLK